MASNSPPTNPSCPSSPSKDPAAKRRRVVEEPVKVEEILVVVKLLFLDGSRVPVLEMEVLGHTHTWTDIGGLLFTHYLGAIRGEGLNVHLWRFYPKGRVSSALDPSIPILSPHMGFVDPYDDPYGDSDGDSDAPNMPLHAS
jgi:hypothetical protein